MGTLERTVKEGGIGQTQRVIKKTVNLEKEISKCG